MVRCNSLKWLKQPLYGVIAAAVLLLVLLGTSPAGAPALHAQAPTGASDCGFVFGFATLRELIIRSDPSNRVGDCLENEYHAPNGDGLQWTTQGLMIWRKSSNWTGFTDGQNTWVNGPFGLQKRPSASRLSWEPAPATDIVTFLSGRSRELPQLIEVDEAVRYTLVLHQANEGATFNMYFGDLAGQRLYAVSLYPDRSVVIEGKQIPLAVLRRFFLDNRDLWVDPQVSVGTWFSTDGNMTYLDISATIPDRELAIQLGKKYNQTSIFDLFNLEEIQTGGTGEAVPNLPPADERLPKFAFLPS